MVLPLSLRTQAWCPPTDVVNCRCCSSPRHLRQHGPPRPGTSRSSVSHKDLRVCNLEPLVSISHVHRIQRSLHRLTCALHWLPPQSALNEFSTWPYSPSQILHHNQPHLLMLHLQHYPAQKLTESHSHPWLPANPNRHLPHPPPIKLPLIRAKQIPMVPQCLVTRCCHSS
jgi:hypothetical protein